jgi:uncharacterized protein (DUF433 family)
MIGLGMYTLAEVARLTEVHPSTVRTWFKGRSDQTGRGPVFQADYEPVGHDYAVSFLDLIDALVAGQFRFRYKVPMKVVRRAYEVLKEDLGTNHPFCHTDLHTDGQHIFRLVAEKLGEEKLSDVVSRQQFFLHIMQKLDHIDYSEASKLAHRWRISSGIFIDPSISMGKPVIQNTGVTTYVIANQYHANTKNSALVADLYKISENDVINAVNFELQYGRQRVA